MPFKITPRQSGDVTILDCEGRLTLGEGAGLFRDTIRNLVADGKKNLVANFVNLEYIDSRGVHELMVGADSARDQDGDLRLLDLGKRVRGALLITKVYSDFKVFDDEATAAQSFLNEPGGWSQRTEPGRSR